MVRAITVPKLGLTMTKATIVEWLKNEGDQVKKGEPIVQIETEKVSHKVEAPDQGVLLKIVVSPKAVAQVGETIAYIGQPGEAIPETVAPAAASAELTSKLASTAPLVTPRPKQIRASPRAKRLAGEKGVDLSKVTGSGPGGMIMEDDVLKYIEASLYRTRYGLKVKELISMSETRRVIAENMVSSLQSMAQVTLMAEADVTQLQKLRSSLQVSEDGKSLHVTYTDMLVKIVAKTLEEHSIINSTLEDDQIKVIEEINIGVAVAVETGLIVPVVKDANKKSLHEISFTLRGLVDKARQGNLTLDDVTGGTFTITNLGAFGIDTFTPIINPPQAAILGIGRIVEKPIVIDGNIVVRPMMTLSLSFDHRVMDGHTAAIFLKKLKEKLESSKVMETLSS